MSSLKALAGLLSLTLVTVAVPAQQDPDARPIPTAGRRAAPLRVPPEFATVSKVDADNGTLQLRKTTLVAQVQEVAVTVNRDGRNVQEKRMVTQQVPVIQEFRVDLKQHRFVNGRGDKVANKKALAKLEEGKVLLICWDVNGVEEKVLKVLAADALILIPKDAGAPASVPKEEKEEPRREDRSDR
jgi:hypothetical protein